MTAILASLLLSATMIEVTEPLPIPEPEPIYCVDTGLEITCYWRKADLEAPAVQE